MSFINPDICQSCGFRVSDCVCESDHEIELRALTDIDVRHPEDDTGTEIPGTDIEFATFCEGEYVESVILPLARAVEIRDALSKLIEEATG
jgi:hypothetical protein